MTAIRKLPEKARREARLIARDLHSTKYRQRIVPKKKRQPYEWDDYVLDWNTNETE